MQSTELPATTDGEWRRRHSLQSHKGGPWTVPLTSCHHVSLQGGFLSVVLRSLQTSPNTGVVPGDTGGPRADSSLSDGRAVRGHGHAREGRSHFRRQPASTCGDGGNAGMPVVLCTIQLLSAFSPSSILASAYWAFHRPSRERKRYYSLWSSVFPVPSARRGITSCSRLSPDARCHNSSRQPRHIVYLAMAVAAAVRDRRCGVFRHADSFELSSS